MPLSNLASPRAVPIANSPFRGGGREGSSSSCDAFVQCFHCADGGNLSLDFALESHSRTSTFAHVLVLSASPCIVMGNASGQPVPLSMIVRRVLLPSHGGFNGPTKSM